jgi:hypothetical protein
MQYLDDLINEYEQNQLDKSRTSNITVLLYTDDRPKVEQEADYRAQKDYLDYLIRLREQF